jgi:hypothetical protein
MENLPDGKAIARLLEVPPLELVLQPLSALCLLSHLQLALRHPAMQLNHESTRKVRQIAAIIEDHLGQASPQIAELCAAGWNAEHDVPGGAGFIARSATPFIRISDEHWEETCMPGRGIRTCRYMGVSGRGFECLKLTADRAEIDRRVSENRMIASGDNCPGWDHTRGGVTDGSA